MAPADSLCDARTCEVLDWSAICERVAAQTHSDRATVWARELKAGNDFSAARIAIEQTTEMRALLGESFSLQRVIETRDVVAAAQRGGVMAAADLRAVAVAVSAGNAAVRRVREAGGERLRERCAGFVALPEIASKIEEAIGERGEVLDRASRELARLRRGISTAQAEARDRTTSIARSSRYRAMLQDDVVTVREGRFVVPVKAEFSGSFPGIVHDSSASGQTYFVEPLDALEANNRLRALRVQEEHEVARILGELSRLVGAQAEHLERNAQIYAELDLVYAKAQLAESTRSEPPRLEDKAVLTIVSGRHPLLAERAVAQSLDLDEQTRMLLISGPNMGGKTVTLKMVGLFVLMAYAGMHLPAEAGTVIGRFETVFADVGDEQSIAQNASTFSEHLRRYAEIAREAGPRSLVLMDEVGSGTEPSAGAALAVAISERLLAAGALTVATTHSSELKLFAHSVSGVRNASVRFDPKTYAPTYELDMGSPGQSLAFPLARAMHVDPKVVERAEEILSSSERDYERALSELAELHSTIAAEREALVRERARTQQLEAQAEEERRKFESERREFARQAEQRLTEGLRAFVRDLERRSGDRRRGKVTPGQGAALSRALGEVHRELGIDRTRRSQAPGEIHVGDRVVVGTLEQEGSVVAIDEGAGEAIVQVGPMRTTVKKEDLVPVTSAARPARGRDSSAGERVSAIAAHVMPEVDVRGKRLIEAEPIVEHWLDEAVALGHSPLRLIHGKGTGLLGRGLQEYLKTNPNVRGFRYGNETEGGGGVTIIELRK